MTWLIEGDLQNGTEKKQHDSWAASKPGLPDVG
jgi:hypothetical protein